MAHNNKLGTQNLIVICFAGIIYLTACTNSSMAQNSVVSVNTETFSTLVEEESLNSSTPIASSDNTSNEIAETDKTIPGEVFLPFPTINNLSIEWLIEGDENNNSVVEVRYRELEESGWHLAMPLRRIPAGSTLENDFSWNNKHSGSVFDLKPATTYDIELSLIDPDGGSMIYTTTVKTRAIPKPVAGATIVPVTPETVSDKLKNVQPGDILLFGPGEYQGFMFTIDGEPTRPIVLKGEKGAVINGSVFLDNRKHIIIDGFLINGSVQFNNSDSISVINCQVFTEGDGINFQGNSINAYIANNYIHGGTVWQKTSLGVSGDNHGEGIQFSGSGHVVEHNTIIGFRDNISLMEGAGEAFNQYSIDILYNDIYEAADDGIEADYCFNNCRIIGNRLTNVFMGLSSQPGLGGPTYFIRNVMYNVVYEPFKLHNGSVGDVILHNTIVKNGDAFGVYTSDYFSQAFIRNNIFIGGPGGTYNGYYNGKGLAASLMTADPTCSLDYDAYGSLASSFYGQIGNSLFLSFENLLKKTTEKNAIQVDLNVFETTPLYPEEPFPAFELADLRPKAGSTVEDAALLISNINDEFSGSGPDIGAYEVGQSLPEYGAQGVFPGQ